MKRVLMILMFLAVSGMFAGAVSAGNLHPHDFDGKFTLDVPSDDFRCLPGTSEFHDLNSDLSIEYLTADDIHERNCNDFEEYIDECLRLDKVESDGDLTVYQDGKDYVVTVHSDDELFIVTDENLEEAKAIASSADLENTSAGDTNESSEPAGGNAELKSQDFHGLFKMDVPKDSDFGDTENYDKKMATDSITYEDEVNNVSIHYIDDEDFDDQVVKDTVDGLKQQGAEVTTDGNLYIISANGANEIIFHDGPKTVMLSSGQLDSDTLTDMAKSIEITE